MKTVLISGGTRGLGLAATRELARSGYRVVVTGRKMSECLRQFMESESAGSQVSFAPFDLADSAGIRSFVDGLVKSHGDIYGLVNNAAIGHEGILATMHDTEITELLNVNVLGSILMAKYVSRSMLIRREGRIINIASIIGHTGFTGLSVYAATKSAMLGFSKSLAREMGRAGITVNSVSPGFMETDMTSKISPEKLQSIRRRSPLGRLATVDDAAKTIAFLMSSSASSITGTDIVVDAGSTA